MPLYRYWNSRIADHFYTTNWGELGNGRYGWAFESIQCYVLAAPAPGSMPLYRYWNGAVGDHFYTTDWNELGGGRYGWSYEGVQCHVFPNAVSRVPQMADELRAGQEEETHSSVAPAFAGVAALAQIPASFTDAGSGQPAPSFAGAASAAPPPSFAGGQAEGQPPASFAAHASGQPPSSFASGASHGHGAPALREPQASTMAGPGASFATTTSNGNAGRDDDDAVVRVTVHTSR